MGWKEEFGEDLAIPECVMNSGLEDTSWNNNTGPIFCFYKDAREYALWCCHPDPDQRDIEGSRYRITVQGASGIKQTLFETDYVSLALLEMEVLRISI